MGRKKKNGSKKQRGRRDPPSHLSASAIVYRGPMRIKQAKDQQDTITVSLFFVGNLSSTSAAVLNQIYADDPASAGDWSNFTASWQEFRVLGMELKYFPANRYSKSTTVCVPIVGVVDRSSSSLLSSYSQAYSYASARILSLEDPFDMKARMADSTEAEFQPVGNYNPYFYFKFYGDSLSVSTTYGKVFITYLIEFRGRA